MVHQSGTTSLNETKQTSGTIDGISAYYSNAVAPTVFKLLTVNYYDDYNFTSAPTFPAYSFDNVPSFYNNSTVLPKGLSTGSWVRVLTTSGSTAGETSYVLYDSKARPIENYTANYLGGFTRTDIKLDFPGKPYLTYTTHRRTASDATILVQEGFTYSPQGRLLTHTHQIGTGTVQLLASNTYDELGQLIAKKVGGVDTTGATGLQTVDYTYNIRGWLKGINDVATINVPGNGNTDLFAFKINYNDITDPTKKLYNGNISQTSWMTANTDKTLRSYTYAYDKLNRLKTATDPLGRYNENLWYDRNGNITALTRLGNTAPGTATFGTIDNLAYTYDTGNKLIKVEDSSGNTEGFTDGSHAAIEYTYDANGNMTSDLNKGIGTATTAGITYNHLNLPTKIIFATGSTTGNIVYIYNAVGQKVQKIVNQLTPSVNTTTTDYLGGIQYTKINSGIVNLQFLPTAEGYVEPVGSSYKYVFQYKDHLGNVRLSYKDVSTTSTPSLQIVTENNYYPFGLIQKGYNYVFNSTNPALNYKYNGKELQDELSLNLYDYGARNYDPALGRWMNVDPLAEKYQSYSSYSFVGENPLSHIEVDGKYWHRSDSGTLVADKGDTAKTLAKFTGKSVQEARAEFNHNHYRFESTMEGGESFYQSDRAVSSGEYGPSSMTPTTEEVATGMQNFGDGITVLGIGTAQPEIAGAGEVINKVGLGIEVINNLMNGGNKTDALIKVGISVGFSAIGNAGVKATEKVAGKIAVKAGENKISEGIIKSSTIATEKTLGKSIEDKLIKK